MFTKPLLVTFFIRVTELIGNQSKINRIEIGEHGKLLYQIARAPKFYSIVVTFRLIKPQVSMNLNGLQQLSRTLTRFRK